MTPEEEPILQVYYSYLQLAYIRLYKLGGQGVLSRLKY